ncbi:hypothetical protein BDW59DRAFT_138213 [Aspergillus cavernicola]|uniref:GA4 desaturase family protein n=1 Tax=Aspergillus cavernicola TaxID=176166 RepID=A0ABR4J1V8_9EURO
MAEAMRSIDAGRSLTITLDHLQESSILANEKAYELYIPLPPSLPQTNMRFVPCEAIIVRDARQCGLENFTLERTGFEWIKHSFQDSLDKEKVAGPQGSDAIELYLKTLVELVKTRMKAETVIIYDWRIRSTTSTVGLPRPADRHVELGPAQWIHADESARGGMKTLREHLNDAERSKLDSGKGRFRLMNIWRPLVSTVRARPLALCDLHSVSPEDWELCDQIHVDRVDEAMYLKRRDNHSWWWLPEQRDDELTFFIVWDSKRYFEGAQASTPHGAFDLPASSEMTQRHSIEVRSIFWTED